MQTTRLDTVNIHREHASTVVCCTPIDNRKVACVGSLRTICYTCPGNVYMHELEDRRGPRSLSSTSTWPTSCFTCKRRRGCFSLRSLKNLMQYPPHQTRVLFDTTKILFSRRVLGSNRRSRGGGDGQIYPSMHAPCNREMPRARGGV